MKSSDKKLIAPIVITILLFIYLAVFCIAWLYEPIPTIWRIIGSIVPLGMMGASIFVLVERIKEIRSGEEDDLGKY